MTSMLVGADAPAQLLTDTSAGAFAQFTNGSVPIPVTPVRGRATSQLASHGWRSTRGALSRAAGGCPTGAGA